MPKEEGNIILEEPTMYESFYVPDRARWNTLKNLNLNIGRELDKAFKEIEDDPKNAELIITRNTKDIITESNEINR